MRSATARAATSGFVVVVVVVVIGLLFFPDLVQQKFDASAALRRLVVLEVELRRVAQTDALAEKPANGVTCMLELLHHITRLVFLVTADVDACEVQIGAHVDRGDRRQPYV